MDREEFKRVWIPLSPDLFKLGFLLLKSGTEAEDALQDLLLKLWNMKEELSGVGNPKGYALVLMKHLCIDRIRKRERFRRYEGELEFPDRKDPETQSEIRESAGLLEQVIRDLPREQQRVVRMRFFEEKDYEEISRLTGRTEGSVRVTVCRARETIRKRLNQK